MYTLELAYVKHLKLLEVTVYGKIPYKRLEYYIVLKNGKEMKVEELYKDDSGESIISILQTKHNIPTIKVSKASLF